MEEELERVARQHRLPEWAKEKMKEHRITHVVTEEGRKHISKASKEEIIAEIMKRDLLRWAARRAGRADVEEAVLAGKYYEMEEEIREAMQIAMSRAVREMVSRATFPNESEVREALQMYMKMFRDPEIAKIVRVAVDEGKIADNVNHRTIELLREGILSGALWAPPHWNIRINYPIHTR